VGTAPKTSVGLAIELMVEIVTDIENIGRKVIHTLDDLEDRVLDNDINRIAAEIGLTRRQIIRLRRQVLPLRQNISKSVTELPKWATTEEFERSDALLSRIERIGSEIVEAQEQARILQDETGARAAENTNRNMYILTLSTVIMLPLNLITGFFGMNVQGLPGVGVDGGFEWVTAGMVATLLLMLAYFKWKRWF
jgi:zinc transporter